MRDLGRRLNASLGYRYVVERELGSGGMATVYLADDRKHHRPVALKVLDPELAASVGPDRFLREIEVAARLTHPNILPLHDSGEADGLLFYVMPYVEGESLRERLSKEKQLPVQDAVRIAWEIADALACAHAHDVIHRDVKPANIMLEEGHAVLADFGVAQAVADADGTRLTRTGMSVGTPSYMSPEQIAADGDLDARSDQYSLGCVLYEMLTGAPPFVGPSAQAVLGKILTQSPPDVAEARPTVPNDVAEALSRSLARTPADRFADAGAFRDALGSHLTSPAMEAGGATGPRRGLGQAGMTVAAVGLAAAALLVWSPWSGPSGSVTAAGAPAWTVLAEVEGSAPEDIRSIVGRLLASEIDQSGVVIGLSESQIQLGLASALKPDTTPIDHAVARELAVRGNVETVFAPVLDQVGDGYALTVRVRLAEPDSVLVVESATAGGEQGLIPAVTEVVGALTTVLADRAGTVRLHHPAAITPSFEAFRRWAQADDMANQNRHQDVVRLLKEALAIDPDFASAWVRLGVRYQILGYRDSARAAMDEGLARPERLAGFERLFADFVDEWQRSWDADLQEQYRIAQRMVREYGSDRAYNNLAISLNALLRTDEAIAVMEELEARSPFGLSELQTANLASQLRRVGDIEGARMRAAQLPSGPTRLSIERDIASGNAEWDLAEQLAMELLRSPEAALVHRRVSWIDLGLVHAAKGRIQDAIDDLHRSGELETDARGRRGTSQRLLTLAVASEAHVENLGFSPLPADTTPEGLALAGLWNLHGGDLDRARHFAAGLTEPDMDADGLAPGVDAPQRLLFARLKLAEGDWYGVIQLMGPHLGAEPWPAVGPYRLLAEWTAAEAFEHSGQLDSAAVHFERVANPTGRTFWTSFSFRGFTHAFAHRRAALLYGRLGETDKAIEHWRVVLEDFTDPDPDYEWMVEEARVELGQFGG